MTYLDWNSGNIYAVFPSELPRTGQVAQSSNRVLKLTFNKILKHTRQVGFEHAFKINQTAIFMLFQPKVRESVVVDIF